MYIYIYIYICIYIKGSVAMHCLNCFDPEKLVKYLEKKMFLVWLQVFVVSPILYCLC